MDKKIEKIVKKIDEEFKNRGFEITEDLIELVETTESVSKALANTNFNNIEIFQVDEENAIGFTLDEMQVNFFIEYGEDEEGPWYEASVEIINF
ncbi:MULTISPECIES: hypothetical protein [Fusobacterium]|uniref:hypothetical protein n=1 Tax=Fusobacterium TaxID=848 RepID=UPI0005632F5B|nr:MULTISPECIES: hypothetical protein [Fusobacterium]MCI6151817.1 hypothetical protein [Fusobacterium perfoetens]MDY3236822.1 hypothetical protein [Fusobacterium perfoetens]NME35455.1 hypothetical protein [Fusobacterium sp. FSA-380-WT-3A]